MLFWSLYIRAEQRENTTIILCKKKKKLLPACNILYTHFISWGFNWVECQQCWLYPSCNLLCSFSLSYQLCNFERNLGTFVAQLNNCPWENWTGCVWGPWQVLHRPSKHIKLFFLVSIIQYDEPKTDWKQKSGRQGFFPLLTVHPFPALLMLNFLLRTSRGL